MYGCDSKECRARANFEQILKRGLDIDSRSDRKLSACGGNLAGWNAKVLEEGFA